MTKHQLCNHCQGWMANEEDAAKDDTGENRSLCWAAYSGEHASAPPASGAEAVEALARVESCLGFLRSVVQCGEPWSETCEKSYQEAKADCATITKVPGCLVGGSEVKHAYLIYCTDSDGTVYSIELLPNRGYALSHEPRVLFPAIGRILQYGATQPAPQQGGVDDAMVEWAFRGWAAKSKEIGGDDVPLEPCMRAALEAALGGKGNAK